MLQPTIYHLRPLPEQNQQSFYGKANVEVAPNGDATLVSYETPVLLKKADGTLVRLWDGWSATTGRHIYAFAQIRKKDWDKLTPHGENHLMAYDGVRIK